jgi:hypothetical protein
MQEPKSTEKRHYGDPRSKAKGGVRMHHPTNSRAKARAKKAMHPAPARLGALCTDRETSFQTPSFEEQEAGIPLANHRLEKQDLERHSKMEAIAPDSLHG